MLAITASVPLAATTAVSGPPLEENLEEIVVSGAFEGRKLGETIMGTTVLREEEISRLLAGSLGETLKSQPGMSSTFFGPGSSRPIIRGLGGDRIRMLDAGLGSIDASSTSPDHATAVEPALAERIEILRGTAMLMYGSSAAGGVVNVFDGRIPTAVPEKRLSGAFRYGHSTVDNGDEFSGAFDALLTEGDDLSLVLHGDVLYRETDDYDIPGYAESALLRALEEEEHDDHDDEDHDDEDHDEDHDDHDDDHDEEEAFGILENSATKTWGGSGGLSLIFKNGFIGMNVKVLDSEYGLPGGHTHGEEEHDHDDEDHDDEDHDEEDHEDEDHDEHDHEDELVTIALKQVRYDLHGEFETDLGFFKKAKFRFGYADYEHIEYEGEEVGTIFANEGWEGRLDLIEKGGDNWAGATGIQHKHRDFSAVGAEAFVPPTVSDQFGLYTVKELNMGDWTMELGGRYEHTKHTQSESDVSRTFDGFSFSAGAGYDLSEDAFMGVTVFRTERAPSTEELFSNGPHLATGAFEVGDANLGMETAFGIEGTFTYATGPFSLVLNLFHTDYDDFIYEVETGEEEDGLEVFAFGANDAKFYGMEAKAEFHAGAFKVGGLGEVDVHLDGQVDYVRAKLTGDVEDADLPRIPPLSTLVGVTLSSDKVDLRTEVEYNAEQNDVTEHELVTDDYTLWNAYVTVRPFENKNIALELKGTNLGNVDARQHTSFLKDSVPLPGRNVKVSLRAAF